jgi:cellobiose-specific phosphotransferase system component IIB
MTRPWNDSNVAWRLKTVYEDTANEQIMSEKIGHRSVQKTARAVDVTLVGPLIFVIGHDMK